MFRQITIAHSTLIVESGQFLTRVSPQPLLHLTQLVFVFGADKRESSPTLKPTSSAAPKIRKHTNKRLT